MKYAIEVFSGITTIGSGVHLILSRVTVTKDGVRIGSWIYWILTGRNYK
jgi:hypothetical protein